MSIFRTTHQVIDRLSIRRATVVIAAACAVSAAASPAHASPCIASGATQFGFEAPFFIDADCVDPDYNEATFTIDSVKSLDFALPDGKSIPYTEVKGHFAATRTKAELPDGVTGSPTTADHPVTWRFPDRAHWRNRFFQQSYPLAIDSLNTVDSLFAFTNGAYTVSVTPGNSLVGYRVAAAAAKLSKTYARKLYGDVRPIYGYIYGQSGGSVQMMAANEGTVGVWDGIIPVVIATDNLNTHSFQWAALYAIGMPEAKRTAISDAVAPGSGRDIYAGLNPDEHAVLDELLNAGFARKALEGWKFSLSSAIPLSGALANFDAAYEDDFWSKPGYEGVSPPPYLAAAKVDGFATIIGVERKAGAVTALTFDPATVPTLGSTGTDGLQYYVYDADGASRIVNGNATTVSGQLTGNVLKLTGADDPILLSHLIPGAKIRINNRFALAAAFYPRHSIPDDVNPAYNQYRHADGTPKYVQRPIGTAYIANLGAAGGRRETGMLTVRTIVFENLFDPGSYPFVANFYAGQVRRALGPSAADRMFRLYYQDNAPHGAFPNATDGSTEAAVKHKVASVGGILNQALLDLAAWVERGVEPLPSTRYRQDDMNQIVLPASAKERRGLQPVVTLLADGRLRTHVRVNQSVALAATAEMPDRAGKIVNYAWHIGPADTPYDPTVKISNPRKRFRLDRSMSFPTAGEYEIILRVNGQRHGSTDVNGTALLQNVARARVVVSD